MLLRLELPWIAAPSLWSIQELTWYDVFYARCYIWTVIVLFIHVKSMVWWIYLNITSYIFGIRDKMYLHIFKKKNNLVHIASDQCLHVFCEYIKGNFSHVFVVKWTQLLWIRYLSIQWLSHCCSRLAEGTEYFPSILIQVFFSSFCGSSSQAVCYLPFVCTQCL